MKDEKKALLDRMGEIDEELQRPKRLQAERDQIIDRLNAIEYEAAYETKFTFCPPMKIERGQRQSQSLIKHVDGSYELKTALTPSEINAAERVFIGGHDEPVDLTEAASLRKAGYGDYVREQRIPPSRYTRRGKTPAA